MNCPTCKQAIPMCNGRSCAETARWRIEYRHNDQSFVVHACSKHVGDNSHLCGPSTITSLTARDNCRAF